MRSVSLSYSVALQALKANPLHEEDGAGMQADRGLAERSSGDVFFLDILSHRMSEIACFRQLAPVNCGCIIEWLGRLRKPS